MVQPERSDASSTEILIFSDSFFPISETFIHRQVNALRKKFTVELMGYKLLNQEQFNVHGVQFVKLDKKVSRMEWLFRTFQRRILKINSPYTSKIKLAFKRYFENHKVVVHAHYGWNGIFLLPFLKRHNIPLVVSFHGNDASGLLKKPGYKEKLPALFEYASAVIVCSEHMINNLSLHPYLHKVKVIPYGVDISDFSPYLIENASDKIKILHSGRMVPKKGVADLIEVFGLLKKKYPNTYLQIVGDGSEKEPCELLTQRLGLQHSVEFFGAQPQSKVKELMNACDIFVLNSRVAPSGDMEGLPNSVLEAMAFEKPVVSTYHAGIPMAVDNEQTGLLVQEFDNTGLYQALERLIQDEHLRKKLGKNGRKKLMSGFTIENMETSLNNLFEKIVSTKKH